MTATTAPPTQVAGEASTTSYGSPAGVAKTAGWGWTVAGSTGAGVNALNETYVPLRTSAECTAGLATVGTFDPATMVCAGATGPTTTTCHGDSGGPLIVFTGSGDTTRPVL